MAKQTLQTLRNWFTNLAKPRQDHFWDWMDSFWHKDEKIPPTTIDGLKEALDDKISNAAAKVIEGKADKSLNELVDVRTSVGSLATHVDKADTAIQQEAAQALGVVKGEVDTIKDGLPDIWQNINGILEMLKQGASVDEAKAALLALGSNYKDVYSIASTLKTFLNSKDLADSTINSWKEIESFLSSITDTQTLTGMLENLSDNVLAECKEYTDKTYAPIENNASWYVDSVNGSDSNDGRTLTTAKKTVLALIDYLESVKFNPLDPDTKIPSISKVYLQAGHYNISLMLHQSPTVEYLKFIGTGDSTTIRISMIRAWVIFENVKVVGDWNARTSRLYLNRCTLAGTGFVSQDSTITIQDGLTVVAPEMGAAMSKIVVDASNLYVFCDGPSGQPAGYSSHFSIRDNAIQIFTAQRGANVTFNLATGDGAEIFNGQFIAKWGQSEVYFSGKLPTELWPQCWINDHYTDDKAVTRSSDLTTQGVNKLTTAVLAPHSLNLERDLPDCHPIKAITGLEKRLDDLPLGSDNFILDHTSRTGLGNLPPWDMSDATPKGRLIRFSFDVDSAAAVGAYSQINFYNKTTGGRKMGDVLDPFPFGKSTIDMVTVIPEGFDQISLYLNAPSTVISNLYLRESPDYSSLREQLVHDEFWTTIGGNRRQVYMRTFIGEFANNSSTILIPEGIEEASVVTGRVSVRGDRSAVTEKSFNDDLGDGPSYWEVNTDGSREGALEILTPFHNLSGMPFSITIKYIKS